MVVANVPNFIMGGGYIVIKEKIADSLEQTYGWAPEAMIDFANNIYFPVVRFRSAMKWEDSSKLLLFSYDVHSVCGIENAPSGVKKDGQLDPTPENIATLLEGEESTKTIEVLLYDKLQKTYGQKIVFFIWGQERPIVQAYNIKQSGEDRAEIFKAAGRALDVEFVPNKALALLAPGGKGRGELYPEVLVQNPILLKDALESIAPRYILPSNLFMDFTGREVTLQPEFTVGKPNEKAVNEIVYKLLPVAVNNLEL